MRSVFVSVVCVLACCSVTLAGGAAARMRFSATYTHNEATRDAQMQSAFTDMAKGTPEQQAKLAELDAKEAALRKALLP
jgi:hypothetical protein